MTFIPHYAAYQFDLDNLTFIWDIKLLSGNILGISAIALSGNEYYKHSFILLWLNLLGKKWNFIS